MLEFSKRHPLRAPEHRGEGDKPNCAVGRGYRRASPLKAVLTLGEPALKGRKCSLQRRQAADGKARAPRRGVV